MPNAIKYNVSAETLALKKKTFGLKLVMLVKDQHNGWNLIVKVINLFFL